MRIYQSAIVAANELGRELKEMGIHYQSDTVQDKYVGDDPNFMTLELMAYSYCIQNYKDLEELLDHMNMNKEWVHAEVKDRLDFSLANKNPGTAWKIREDFWGQYLREGVFSYAYPERYHAQLPYIIRELKSRPNTRQAILSFYESTKDMMNWGGYDRVPCSLSYQFFIRNDMLHIIYAQRSCDYTLFYASDVYTTIKLMEFVAYEVGVKPGYFYHNIGSLHCFRGQVEDMF
jgi:thymidylate synthase